MTRKFDCAPGVVGVSGADLPPLPDEIGTNPEAGRVDPRAWFERPDRPLEIEIGSGKGTFILAQAGRDPATNYLGVEWAGEFYAYAADRVRRRREATGGPRNVRLLHADATEFLRWRVPSGIVRVIHLYFSDPWPKRKHWKKRVVQDRFLADVWRVLERGGELRVVTDHDGLWAWYEEHFARWTCPQGWATLGIPPEGGGGPFERVAFEPQGWVDEGELVGTNFERKFRAEGRRFRAACLRKVHS
ncbi:MAG: hypothetical protein DYG93_10660 [Leptolyngbya sp. PLA2]|nr:hypothetical protein [Leptolyngbya sp.]MCE7972105.1 hypothetical protein [Leptolyngbya sp. PL-A2]MCQ3941488.1 hypothetical protein [cyanobacterium CYA1]MCZ7634512.1 hypothetical protein [Phycisphaerales bacterium]MDL1905708.1 hypothetical protein [Synechococcales cyanobacterium CNB]GIK20476.1 MAG: hypothetical protein BroJett004_26400 [Planctomycetota bacterium]